VAHRVDVTTHMALEIVEEPELERCLCSAQIGVPDVVLLGLPAQVGNWDSEKIRRVAGRVADLAERLPDGVELVIYGDLRVLPRVHAALPPFTHYHLAIAVRCAVFQSQSALLPHEHKGLIFYGKNAARFSHTRVRIAYTYCPACGKTTKDYGGRKHLYDAYGTLMSDVWKDFQVSPDDPLPHAVLQRVRDLLSTDGRELMIAGEIGETEANVRGNTPDSRPAPQQAARNPVTPFPVNELPNGTLAQGDVLDVLSTLPGNSVDLAFADPPYNLSKQYRNYTDNVDVEEYFSWCDRWLGEYLRVLKPGRILAVLNIPLWALRHALYLDRHAEMCNWVVWEAMSMPVRLIMPSHYAMLLYRKPGAATAAERRLLYTEPTPPDVSADIQPLDFDYCRRASCVSRRSAQASTRPLTDLWTDIDRLKHNAFRWDHPCQLPPRLMRRLIACTTNPGELVLDAFNGIGTTTLAAQQIGRRFIGIEVSRTYHETALERHQLLANGEDPFAKRKITPEAKNNRVPRQGLEKYAVAKKTLQLAVKNLAEELGRMPTKEDVADHLPYPVSYFEQYFKSWSEVLAAARTTGMSELPPGADEEQVPLRL